MSTEKAMREKTEARDGSDTRLDRAIDELRGVLKREPGGRSDAMDELKTGDENMSAGTGNAKTVTSDFGSDFGGSDFAADFAPDANDDPFAMTGPAGSTALQATEAPDFASDFGPDAADALFAPKPDARQTAAARIPDAGAATKASIVGADAPVNLDLIMDIPIDMQIVLGKSRMPVSGLMNLSEGALIGLDRKIGEPVEIMVNGRLFGRGEITVLEGDETRFGVKLIEVIGGATK